MSPKGIIDEKANGPAAEAQHTFTESEEDVDVGPVLSWKNHKRAPPDW